MEKGFMNSKRGEIPIGGTNNKKQSGEEMIKNNMLKIMKSWHPSTMLSLYFGSVYVIVALSMLFSSVGTIKLPFDYVNISVSLAGFVLVAGAFYKDNKSNVKNQFFWISKNYIFSAISLMVFYGVTPLITTKIDSIITLVFFSVLFIISFFSSLITFSFATIKLLQILQKISKRSNAKSNILESI